MGSSRIGVAAVVAVGLLTAGTWHFGLHADDYFMLRPHTWAELTRVWHGTWDTGRVWPNYYRPLSVWANEAIYLISGYHPLVLRTIVAMELVAIAWALGVFVARELASSAAGLFAAALVAVQPAAVLSTIWTFQENHRWSAGATIAALLFWQRLRRRPSAGAWWPIHVVVLVGCLFKEEVLLVEPLLIVWQWARARVLGDVPPPSLAMSLTIGAGCAASLALRTWLLGSFGGEWASDWSAYWVTYDFGRALSFGLMRFHDLHGKTSLFQWAATIATAAVWVTGAGALWRRRSAATLLIFQGATLAAAAAGTMAVSEAWYTRHHLIAIGGVLIASGCVDGLVHFGTRRHRALAHVAGVALVLACLLASRHLLLRYAPCTDDTLDEDGSLATWLTGAPAPEHAWVRRWFAVKASLCERGQYHDIDTALRLGELHLE